MIHFVLHVGFFNWHFIFNTSEIIFYKIWHSKYAYIMSLVEQMLSRHHIYFFLWLSINELTSRSRASRILGIFRDANSAIIFRPIKRLDVFAGITQVNSHNTGQWYVCVWQNKYLHSSAVCRSRAEFGCALARINPMGAGGFTTPNGDSSPTT